MTLKYKRWKSKKYSNWVATLDCSNCSVQDGTVVAHHLKGRLSPLSGGTGYKASDWLTIDWQHMFILKTLDEAFNQGILQEGK